MEVSVKVCPKCKQSKSLSDFCKNKSRPDGLNRICKECAKVDALKTYNKPEGRLRAKESNKNYHESFIGQYKYTRAAARTRGIEFLLTEEESLPFYNSICDYCGDPTKGLAMDRIDSNGPYAVGNVVPCCRICNYMKWINSIEDFQKQVLKIYNHSIRDKLVL